LNRTERVENGLPIFENKQYISDLTKLLNSKDLDECYDYKANAIDIMDQSATKLDLTQMSDSASVTARPNIAVRESNIQIKTR
jgi:hypothetical protein